MAMGTIPKCYPNSIIFLLVVPAVRFNTDELIYISLISNVFKYFSTELVFSVFLFI